MKMDSDSSQDQDGPEILAMRHPVRHLWVPPLGPTWTKLVCWHFGNQSSPNPKRIRLHLYIHLQLCLMMANKEMKRRAKFNMNLNGVNAERS